MSIKIYIAAALLLSAAIGYSVWSSYRIRRLEASVEAAKTEAVQKQKHADELESRSRFYEEKIVYLEKNFNEVRTISRKQDEELQRINADVSSARGDVRRARRVRTAAANVGELCAKLAELGYPCE